MLKGQVVFITGASRGIGLAIAKTCAAQGAKVAIASKTTSPHPNLPGTIFSAADEIDEVSKKHNFPPSALPIQCDIRNVEQIEEAIALCVEKLGGIDIVINNASAIWLHDTMGTSMKKYDLMNQVNGRGTYAVTHFALPHLIQSAKLRPGKQHVLIISPPINLNKKWFKNHVAYTTHKYAMSFCCLGMSEEFKEYGIGVNCLWPRTSIATSAVEWIGGDEANQSSRTVDIMSEAAIGILTQDSRSITGNFFIDEYYLRDYEGVKDFEKYRVSKDHKLMLDFFLDEDDEIGATSSNSAPLDSSRQRLIEVRSKL